MADAAALFSPAEFEFLAEESPITVVPKFKARSLRLISGRWGPFQPSIPVDVPLWTALQLRKSQKCTIVWPAWLDVEELVSVLESEKENKHQFVALPFHYIEIATLLFNAAAEDHPDSRKARGLLEDIKTLRAQKIRDGIDQVLKHSEDEQPPPFVKLTNVGAMEVHSMRSTFFKAIDKLYDISKRDPTSAAAAAAASQALRAVTRGGAAPLDDATEPAGEGSGGGEDADEDDGRYTAAAASRAGRRRVRARRRHRAAAAAAAAEAEAPTGGSSEAGEGDGAGVGSTGEVSRIAGERGRSIWDRDEAGDATAGDDATAGTAAAAGAGAGAGAGSGGSGEGATSPVRTLRRHRRG